MATYGKIVFSQENCIIPQEKLSRSPSELDGLDRSIEEELRFYGCDLIQTAALLLKLPQVAAATAQVLFQRFYYSKSFVNHPVEIVAAAAITLASKIEEFQTEIRNVVNVFHRMKQIRTGKLLQPMLLDSNYVNLKARIERAEKRILKELGFLVHVKHPHKFLLALIELLQLRGNQKVVQLAWNYIMDSYKSEVHLLYQPEAIACACIHLSARLMQVPLPNNPAWHDVFNVSKDDMEKMCKEILYVYTFEKPDSEKLENIIADLYKKQEEAKLKAKGLSALNAILAKHPLSSTPTSDWSQEDIESPNTDKCQKRSPSPDVDSSHKKNKSSSSGSSLSSHHQSSEKKQKTSSRESKESRRSHSISKVSKSKSKHKRNRKIRQRNDDASISHGHHYSSSHKSHCNSLSPARDHDRNHHSSSRVKSHKSHHGCRSPARNHDRNHRSNYHVKSHKSRYNCQSPARDHESNRHSSSCVKSHKSRCANPSPVRNHKGNHHSISCAKSSKSRFARHTLVSVVG